MENKEETFESYFRKVYRMLVSPSDKQNMDNLKQLHDKGIQRNTLEIAKKFEKEEYIKETNKLLESADRGFKIIMEEKDKEIEKLNNFIKVLQNNHTTKDRQISELHDIIDIHSNHIKELQAENEKLKIKNTAILQCMYCSRKFVVPLSDWNDGKEFNCICRKWNGNVISRFRCISKYE